jgi:hypothetical protein
MAESCELSTKEGAMRRFLVAATVVALLLLASGRLWAAERVNIELTDGSRIEGEVLMMDAHFVHLSLADQVVTINRQNIKDIRTLSGKETQMENVKDFHLYKTGTGAVKDVGAFARDFGPAIVTVKTPIGLGTGWFCDPATC